MRMPIFFHLEFFILAISLSFILASPNTSSFAGESTLFIARSMHNLANNIYELAFGNLPAISPHLYLPSTSPSVASTNFLNSLQYIFSWSFFRSSCIAFPIAFLYSRLYTITSLILIEWHLAIFPKLFKTWMTIITIFFGFILVILEYGILKICGFLPRAIPKPKPKYSQRRAAKKKSPIVSGNLPRKSFSSGSLNPNSNAYLLSAKQFPVSPYKNFENWKLYFHHHLYIINLFLFHYLWLTSFAFLLFGHAINYFWYRAALPTFMSLTCLWQRLQLNTLERDDLRQREGIYWWISLGFSALSFILIMDVLLIDE